RRDRLEPDERTGAREAPREGQGRGRRSRGAREDRGREARPRSHGGSESAKLLKKRSVARRGRAHVDVRMRRAEDHAGEALRGGFAGRSLALALAMAMDIDIDIGGVARGRCELGRLEGLRLEEGLDLDRELAHPGERRAFGVAGPKRDHLVGFLLRRVAFESARRVDEDDPRTRRALSRVSAPKHVALHESREIAARIRPQEDDELRAPRHLAAARGEIGPVDPRARVEALFGCDEDRRARELRDAHGRAGRLETEPRADDEPRRPRLSKERSASLERGVEPRLIPPNPRAALKRPERAKPRLAALAEPALGARPIVLDDEDDVIAERPASGTNRAFDPTRFGVRAHSSSFSGSVKTPNQRSLRDAEPRTSRRTGSPGSTRLRSSS